MLQIFPRVAFGPNEDPKQCAPFPTPVSKFDLAWLKGTFVVDQRNRLARVTDTIDKANADGEKVRAQILDQPIQVGTVKANGIRFQTADDAQLEQSLRTHAQRQIVQAIHEIRQNAEPVLLPLLKDMQRASLTVDTLRQRVFDKISCLSRAVMTGMKVPELMACKASIMSIIREVSGNELNRMIQAAIDDGSGDSLPTLDCLRMENFARPKDERGAENARLITLANVPEYTEAAPLLDEVQALNQQALMAWAAFNQRYSRAAQIKLSAGLAKLGTKDPTNPYADL